MSAAKLGWVGLTALALGWPLGGCAPVQIHATAERQAVAKDFVRVELSEVDGDVLTFDVFNLSRLQLVVLRDQIVLETAKGRRGREPGGVARDYNVPPGAMHDVRVRFDFSDCKPGDELKVLFDSALLIDGTPVPITPIKLTCG